jgi:hypothetical protein
MARDAHAVVFKARRVRASFGDLGDSDCADRRMLSLTKWWTFCGRNIQAEAAGILGKATKPLTCVLADDDSGRRGLVFSVDDCRSGDHDGRRCDIVSVILIRLPPLGTTALHAPCDATEPSRRGADGLRGPLNSGPRR